MSIIDRSIQRPITTLMAYIGVVLFGLISVFRLSEELFPPISYPQLSIVTPYENAAPEEIESLITKPIEEAVGSASGLRKVTSTSKEGLSVVVAEFGWNQKMDFASLAVREKIDLIKERLPRDAAEPIVIKYNPFERPIMTVSISSSSRERTLVQLKQMVKKWFKGELEKIQGVASVSISGGLDEQVLVDVNGAKLRAADISIVDVTDAISAANLNFPGGTIKESFYEYLVRTLGEFQKVDEIAQLPVRRDNLKESKNPFLNEENAKLPSNRLILLKDLANVQRTVKKITSYSRYNSLPNVTIAIQKQAQSNTLRTVTLAKRKLKELQEQLPKDIHVDIIDDQSKFIQEALDGVRDAAVLGALLAFLVLLLFLKDFVSSMFVVVITPITILATFTLMYFLDLSLNVISMGGVALGVGMILDNAVVEIENVFRKFRADPAGGLAHATSVGSNEVLGALWASTFTSMAVFLPIAFVTGIAGQIFKQLAFVVVFTHLFSSVITFTLLPVLIVKFGKKAALRAEQKTILRRILDFLYQPIAWLENAYDRFLPSFLRAKWPYLFVVFLIFIASLTSFKYMDRVLLPKVDQGQFMVKVDLPVGSRVEFANEIAQKVEAFIKAIPEVKSIASVVGSSKGESSREIVERISSNQAQIIVTLKPDSKKTTAEIVQDAREYFEFGPGHSLVYPARLSYVIYDSALSIGGENDAPIVIQIKGPDLEELKRIALKVQERITKIDGIYGVTNSIAEPFPETKLIINKDRASFYRLSVTSIAQAANIAIKGFTASKFKEQGNEIDIRVQLKESDRDLSRKIEQMTIHSPLDTEVPLVDFVDFKEGKGPSEIKRVSQERTIDVYAKFYKRGFKEVLQDVETAISELHVSNKYSAKIAGEKEEIQESFSSLIFALILSVILVYMIIAAQLESLWQPFLIMFCVPMSLIGVALAMWISHTPLSVVVFLGIILLGGIAVSNGIILITFANQLRAKGMGLVEAAILAGKTRLRPILMTAFATAMGLIPLALGLGAGAKLQAPMAVAVMGGILVATFLTLLVIPALYVGTEEVATKLFKQK